MLNMRVGARKKSAVRPVSDHSMRYGGEPSALRHSMMRPSRVGRSTRSDAITIRSPTEAFIVAFLSPVIENVTRPSGLSRGRLRVGTKVLVMPALGPLPHHHQPRLRG